MDDAMVVDILSFRKSVAPNPLLATAPARPQRTCVLPLFLAGGLPPKNVTMSYSSAPQLNRPRLQLFRGVHPYKQHCHKSVLTRRRPWQQCFWQTALIKVHLKGQRHVVSVQSVEQPTVQSSSDPVSDTLEMLDWGELCSHVARFTCTALGKSRTKTLQIPESQKESLQLQAETDATSMLVFELAAQIEFGGVSTQLVEGGVRRAGRGGMVLGEQFIGIMRLLIAAERLKKAISTTVHSLTSERDLTRLKPVTGPFKTLHIPSSLVVEIARAIEDDGAVKDEASPELAKLRSRFYGLKRRIENILKGWGGEVTERAGRYCVGLPVGSEVPPNALLLGSSRTGGMVYIEPQSVIQLNNELGATYGEAKTAEENVLWNLTTSCVTNIEDLNHALEVVAWFDVAVARARYTNWINGTLPDLLTPPDIGEAFLPGKHGRHYDEDGPNDPYSKYLLHLRSLKHPLLLGQYLMRREEILRKAKRKKNGDLKPAFKTMLDENKPPVPADIELLPETKAVVITGPNTGGKTATLKAMGLCVLMAKCGLGVPCERPAILPCYSAVLADIGDEQSLTSSLSTFSGHLKRIQSLRDYADGRCLVLLDELGTGTDPGEGAALGVALLKRLAGGGLGGALTTLVTTHHGLLTTLAYDTEDAVKFENACVEFDEEKLAPTYRLLMGVPGRSNALNIATRLGMDKSLIDNARKRLGTQKASVDSTIRELQELQDTYTEGVQSAEDSEKEISELNEELIILGNRVKSFQKQLAERKAKIYSQAVEKGKTKLAQAKLELEKAAAQARSTQQKTSTVQRSKKKQSGGSVGSDELLDALEEDSFENWAPKVGDEVYVPQLRRNAKVVKIGPGKKAQVQAGILNVSVSLDKVQPWKRSGVHKGLM